jgi:hypothetical protein
MAEIQFYGFKVQTQEWRNAYHVLNPKMQVVFFGPAFRRTTYYDSIRAAHFLHGRIEQYILADLNEIARCKNEWASQFPVPSDKVEVVLEGMMAGYCQDSFFLDDIFVDEQCRRELCGALVDAHFEDWLPRIQQRLEKGYPLDDLILSADHTAYIFASQKIVGGTFDEPDLVWSWKVYGADKVTIDRQIYEDWPVQTRVRHEKEPEKMNFELVRYPNADANTLGWDPTGPEQSISQAKQVVFLRLVEKACCRDLTESDFLFMFPPCYSYASRVHVNSQITVIWDGAQAWQHYGPPSVEQMEKYRSDPALFVNRLHEVFCKSWSPEDRYVPPQYPSSQTILSSFVGIRSSIEEKKLNEIIYCGRCVGILDEITDQIIQRLRVIYNSMGFVKSGSHDSGDDRVASAVVYDELLLQTISSGLVYIIGTGSHVSEAYCARSRRLTFTFPTLLAGQAWVLSNHVPALGITSWENTLPALNPWIHYQDRTRTTISFDVPENRSFVWYLSCFSGLGIPMAATYFYPSQKPKVSQITTITPFMHPSYLDQICRFMIQPWQNHLSFEDKGGVLYVCCRGYKALYPGRLNGRDSAPIVGRPYKFLSILHFASRRPQVICSHYYHFFSIGDGRGCTSVILRETERVKGHKVVKRMQTKMTIKEYLLGDESMDYNSHKRAKEDDPLGVPCKRLKS